MPAAHRVGVLDPQYAWDDRLQPMRAERLEARVKGETRDIYDTVAWTQRAYETEKIALARVTEHWRPRI